MIEFTSHFYARKLRTFLVAVIVHGMPDS